MFTKTISFQRKEISFLKSNAVAGKELIQVEQRIELQFNMDGIANMLLSIFTGAHLAPRADSAVSTCIKSEQLASLD